MNHGAPWTYCRSKGRKPPQRNKESPIGQPLTNRGGWNEVELEKRTLDTELIQLQSTTKFLLELNGLENRVQLQLFFM